MVFGEEGIDGGFCGGEEGAAGVCFNGACGGVRYRYDEAGEFVCEPLAAVAVAGLVVFFDFCGGDAGCLVGVEVGIGVGDCPCEGVNLLACVAEGFPRLGFFGEGGEYGVEEGAQVHGGAYGVVEFVFGVGLGEGLGVAVEAAGVGFHSEVLLQLDGFAQRHVFAACASGSYGEGCAGFGDDGVVCF